MQTSNAKPLEMLLVHNGTIFVKYKRNCYSAHFVKNFGTKQGLAHLFSGNSTEIERYRLPQKEHHLQSEKVQDTEPTRDSDV